MGMANGLPWSQQYEFNDYQSGDITTWSELTATIPTSLVRTSAIVARGFVFILGDFVTSGSYYRAPVNSDGTLGSWSSSSLGFSTYGFQCLLAGTKLYVIGDGTDTVRYASINTDGTFSSWTTAASLPEARIHGRAIIIGTRMYYIGGVNGSTLKDTVFYADIGTNDIIGSWTTSAKSLPDARALGSLIYTGAKIYWYGGATAPWLTVASGGFEAGISGNSIGEWTTAATSPSVDVYDAGVAVSKNTAYIIGGDGGSGATPSCLYASIDGSGNVGSWSYGTDLPYNAERTASSLVITSSHVYLVGGIYSSGNATKIVEASFSGGANDYFPSGATLAWIGV